VKWEMANTDLVIVGAGFSVAVTDGKAPVMGTFFHRLTPMIILSFTTSSRKRKAVSPARTWRLSY
jgi:hypothetical protein